MNPLRSSVIPVSDPAAGLRITEIFYSLQGEANAAGVTNSIYSSDWLPFTLYLLRYDLLF